MLNMFCEDQSFPSISSNLFHRSGNETVPFLGGIECFFEEVEFFDVIEMIVKVRENLYVIRGMM